VRATVTIFNNFYRDSVASHLRKKKSERKVAEIIKRNSIVEYLGACFVATNEQLRGEMDRMKLRIYSIS